MAGGSKAQCIRNLGNRDAGIDQHHFSPLHPDIFDIGTDRKAHFLLEFSGQIVFGISGLFGQFGKFQFLLCMKLNVIPAAADLG